MAQILTTVKTISDLRNFNSFTLGTDENTGDSVTVYVQGYSNPSDGGGGSFIFKRYINMGVSVSLYPVEDGGVFINSNNQTVSSIGIWIRQIDCHIDVRFYGAFGGGTDCTVAFQKAIDYAADSIENVQQRNFGFNNSNTVYIPNGQYGISQLTLKSGVRLKGSSMSHTTIQSIDDTNNSLIKIESGVNRDIHISDLRFYGNASTYFSHGTNYRYKSCFYISALGESGGLWESSFKNITIQKFTGHSLYFEGSTSANDYRLLNQFITMEGVNVESVGELRTDSNGFNNNYHALELNGLNGQFVFNNCRFDGGSYLFGNSGNQTPEYKVNGIAVYIGTTISGINPSMINFNNCTFQSAETAIQIQSCNNINIIGCWFETLERSVIVKGQYRKSKSINILNCLFSNASGKYGTLPDGTGRVLIAQNAHVNIQNNFVIESTELNDTLSKFVSVDPIDSLPAPNLGINASGNYFEDERLSYSIGIKKDVTLTISSSSIIDIEAAKSVYLKNTSGVSKTVNEINSLTSPGEIVFIKAESGTIKFDETRNIYLGNMNGHPTTPNLGYLDLNAGGVALFVKIDEIITKTVIIGGVPTQVTYYEIYNLISYKLKQ